MTRALLLARAYPLRAAAVNPLELARAALVLSCGLVLALAGTAA